jgi:lysozyme family protein
MDNFTRAFGIVVGVEGGYSNDPADPGGETKYGISKRQYPDLDIANLTLDEAQAIYHRDYWTAIAGDALPWPLALCVFDCAVNQGQPTARTLLQQALGVPADGVLGPATLAAAAASTQWHAARFMMLRTQRYSSSMFYARDGAGWLTRLFTVAFSQGA